jgi:hypothetical protein
VATVEAQKRRNGWPGRWDPARFVPTAAFIAGMYRSSGTSVHSACIKPRLPSHCRHHKLACSGWSAREAGWHVAAVALHSAFDVKCARCLDCPGELRRTVVPVPASQAGGVTSRSTIDVKCARRFDCPKELRRTAVPVTTSSWHAVGGVPERPGWSHVAAMALHSAIDVKCVRRPGEHPCSTGWCRCRPLGH